MVRVGIPRALLYYQYYPMWKTFFQRLGAEVVLSSTTTSAMMGTGCTRMVAETCLPVKVCCGHVVSLVGQCDCLFIPAIRSLESKTHNCSKFLGLPDMMRAVVPEAPPILDTEINLGQGRRAFYRAIYGLGRHFTWNPVRVKAASEAAWQAHLNYEKGLWHCRQTRLQALNRMLEPGRREPEKVSENGDTTPIAVIGHPYLIYDDFINQRLLARLSRLRAKVLTAEMVEESQLKQSIMELVGGPYWTYEAEVVGAGGYYVQSGVEGVIGVAAFGCGPDSLMIEIVQRYARRRGVPFMTLTLDEHTGEAGLITRLEAFLDMIRRRKQGQMACA
jgi:predicted nucleotide-binding protein (sugar kinase/HSP70/actin superfamily)